MGVDDLLHAGGSQGADELVLQVGDADEEAEPFHAGAGELGAETGPLERQLEVTLFLDVAEAGDRQALGREPSEGSSDGLRAPNRHDRNALGGEVPAVAGCQRPDRGLVAQPLDQHDSHGATISPTSRTAPSRPWSPAPTRCAEADRDPDFPDGGAIARVPAETTAFGDRSATWPVWVASPWTDPAEDGVHRDWTREFSESLAPWTTGVAYVNAIGGDLTEARKLAAHGGPAKYERLCELKSVWDPANLFHLNHNIAP